MKLTFLALLFQGALGEVNNTDLSDELNPPLENSEVNNADDLLELGFPDEPNPPLENSELNNADNAEVFTSNLFSVSILHPAYGSDITNSDPQFNIETGGVTWDITTSTYTLQVSPSSWGYENVLHAIGAETPNMKYDICVERKTGQNSIIDQCYQGSNFWSNKYSTEQVTFIQLDRGLTEVTCFPTAGLGHNTYLITVTAPEETLVWGTNENVDILSQEGRQDIVAVRRGYTSVDNEYTLSRDGHPTDNNPIDACNWVLTRKDELDIHVRFYNADDTSDVIQHSTFTVHINGNNEVITSIGFDTTSARGMTETMHDLTGLTTEGIAALVDENNQTVTDTTQTSADIAMGTFQVECEGTLEKLGQTAIKARQISAFKMNVFNCNIPGTDTHEVEVHWESLVDTYDNFVFTLNSCGDALKLGDALFPHAAQNLGQNGEACGDQYSGFQFDISENSADGIVTDRIVFKTAAEGEGDTTANPAVNNCVHSKDGQDMGHCTSDDLTMDEQSINEHISFALAQYEHEDDEAGFKVKFYTVVNDADVRALDIFMELKLDAEFKQQA